MRIVFAGTPEFAVSSLGGGGGPHPRVGVYKNPVIPAARGRGQAPSPGKIQQHGPVNNV